MPITTKYVTPNLDLGIVTNFYHATYSGRGMRYVCKKKMDKYEKAFISRAISGTTGNSDSKSDIWVERQRIMNRQFAFTQSQIKRIETVNEYLAKKETVAFQHATHFYELYLNKIKDSEELDFEIEYKVSLFSEEKYGHIEEMQGNSFFDTKTNISPCLDDSDDKFNHWFFNENHNLHHIDAIKHQNHCMLMHELTEHFHLAWQDIIDIEEVWYEVQITIQDIKPLK